MEYISHIISCISHIISLYMEYNHGQRVDGGRSVTRRPQKTRACPGGGRIYVCMYVCCHMHMCMYVYISKSCRATRGEGDRKRQGRVPEVAAEQLWECCVWRTPLVTSSHALVTSSHALSHHLMHYVCLEEPRHECAPDVPQ